MDESDYNRVKTILHKHISNGTNMVCIISAWMLTFLKRGLDPFCAITDVFAQYC